MFFFSDEREENPGNGRSRFANAEPSPEIRSGQRRPLPQRQALRDPAAQVPGDLLGQAPRSRKLECFIGNNFFWSE